MLTPGEPFSLQPDIKTIMQALRKIKFCGDQLIGSDGKRYLMGERFMQLISFIGCSPYIQLEPTVDDKPFCHLIIDGPYSNARFVRGKNTIFPRCGNCRKRIMQWEHHIAEWTEAPELYKAMCPHCSFQQSPANYDWRHSAGCGHLFLFIENIFPNEARPSLELLKSLQACRENSPDWKFFYIQDSH